jgi:hypothetical protein
LIYYNQSWNFSNFLKVLQGKKSNWEQELSPIVLAPLPSFQKISEEIALHLNYLA